MENAIRGEKKATRDCSRVASSGGAGTLYPLEAALCFSHRK